MMSAQLQYKWNDFHDFFAAANSLVLVGGQACLFYAQYFDIRSFSSTTTKDIDFWGSPEDARKLASVLNARLITSPRKGGMQGLVYARVIAPDGRFAEVLGSVKGLRSSEISSSVLKLKLQGRQIAVLHPLALYESKLANLAEIDQKDRNDLVHCRIMQEVVRKYLCFSLTSEPPRQFLINVERLFDIARSPMAAFATSRQLEHPWYLLPSIADAQDPSIHKWLTLRKPQCDQLLSDQSKPQ